MLYAYVARFNKLSEKLLGEERLGQIFTPNRPNTCRGERRPDSAATTILLRPPPRYPTAIPTRRLHPSSLIRQRVNPAVAGSSCRPTNRPCRSPQEAIHLTARGPLGGYTPGAWRLVAAHSLAHRLASEPGTSILVAASSVDRAPHRTSHHH